MKIVIKDETSGEHCVYDSNSIKHNKVKNNDWLLSKMTGNQEQDTSVTTEQFNEVTKPKHYMLLPDKNVEVRDVVHAVVNRMSNNGYSAMQCSDYAQSLQYVLRFDEKGGVKDLEKAKWYLDKIIAAETTKGN